MDSLSKLKVKNLSDFLATGFLLVAAVSTFLFEVLGELFIYFTILKKR